MEPGERAPDFQLPDQAGNMRQFSEIAPGKTMVVFFYPKDGTPVCTREACSFRDSQGAFEKFQAQVVGISSDSVESHKRFASDNHLDFPLLSDTGGKVRKLWRVPSTFGLLPGRVTYVVDAQGKVRNVSSGQLDPARHVRSALEAVESIASGKA